MTNTTTQNTTQQINATINNTPTTIVNMTPHPINVGGVSIPCSGYTVRAESTQTVVDIIQINGNDISISRMTFGRPIVVNNVTNSTTTIEEWIEQHPNSVFIVSRIAAEAIRDNHGSDVSRLFIIPSDVIRDENGRVIGVRGFSIV